MASSAIHKQTSSFSILTLLPSHPPYKIKNPLLLISHSHSNPFQNFKTLYLTMSPLLLLSLLTLLPALTLSTTPRSLYLVTPEPISLSYHHGPLLTGKLAVNILWYGRFTPSQRSIVSDFLLSLSSPASSPAASTWWHTTSLYHNSTTQLALGRQVIDSALSLGRSLTSDDLTKLSSRLSPHRNTIAVVLTGEDVLVEGFCMSRCGHHGSAPAGRHGRSHFAYIWVGNSVTQCPGECAWPFHQPIYGPQTPPLVAPNGDVGVDGMIINLATLLAATVTNPFGDGYFQGPANAPLEAVTACTGIFGTGSYPGYPGQLLVDSTTGASFNAKGLGGRKYLLPAMWDPKTNQCTTLV
ncbi:Protein EXORDIUM [Rhynchospora pubera]|uniref:Protein EXORDIUM n=1 Tax=Rhynchospora pubera TaxID=906938 RepID=A0AAV8H1P9_9POAL|nr:Protein EXORDIUM [Rhynchospora pubera]